MTAWPRLLRSKAAGTYSACPALAVAVRVAYGEGVWTGLEVRVAAMGAVDAGLSRGVGVGVLPGDRVAAGEGVAVGVWPGVDVMPVVDVPLAGGKGVWLGGGAAVLVGVGGGAGVALAMGSSPSVCDSTGVGAGVPVGTPASLTVGLPVTRRAARCSAVSASAPQIHPGNPRAGRAALDCSVLVREADS
jgi:hypothetical protein